MGGSRKRLPALVPLLASAVLLAGCASGTSEGAEHGGVHGTTLKAPFEAPTVPLTDTDGASYSLADQTDRPLTLLFFGYTHCPDVCQMVMANIASALARLEDDQRADVDVVFVTTDPTRDTEKVLGDYLARFGDGLHGLTGDLGTIVDVAKSYGVFVEKGEKLASGGYDVSHTTNVFAIDAHDETTVTWRAETSPADLAADITRLLEDHA